MDVFASLVFEKKLKQQQKKKIEDEKAAQQTEQANNKAGKLQTNDKKNSLNQQVVAVRYQDRKSRGQVRATYNEGVNKIPGLYNQDGRIVVNITTVPT